MKVGGFRGEGRRTLTSGHFSLNGVNGACGKDRESNANHCSCIIQMFISKRSRESREEKTMQIEKTVANPKES